jgi:hypothetical protein
MEQTFVVRLNHPPTTHTQTHRLRTRKNVLILNGNRYRYNDVMTELRYENKLYREYRTLKDLAILMS